MEKTTNYQLNKPEAGDPMRVADFNENADKIDAALMDLNTAVEGKNIVVGSYTGTGVQNTFIDLGCTPKLAIMFEPTGDVAMPIFITASFCYYLSGSYFSPNGTRITTGGITISGTLANAKNGTINYILFC